MIKLNYYYVTEEYEHHRCSACGRILAPDSYEDMYTIDMDKVTIKLCKKCKSTLARKLNNCRH